MKNVFSLVLLSFLLFTSSQSLRAQQKAVRIAVVPCAIDDLGRGSQFLSTEEILQLERGLSFSLQRELYDHLLDQIDQKHGNALEIQALTETNTLLELSGISLQESWQQTVPQLAAVLDVDVILKVELRYQVGHARQIAGTFNRPHTIPCDDGLMLSPERTFLRARLVEASSGLPLWNTRNNDWVSKGRKNEVIARRIVGELSPSLPAVVHFYAQDK